MALSRFSVVVEHPDAALLIGNPLVRCYAGDQLILAEIPRRALDDYFRTPTSMSVPLQRWNRVVDNNLGAFAQIIEDKFDRDDWEFEGQDCPWLVVTYEDMLRSRQKFNGLGLGKDFTAEP